MINGWLLVALLISLAILWERSHYHKKYRKWAKSCIDSGWDRTREMQDRIDAMRCEINQLKDEVTTWQVSHLKLEAKLNDVRNAVGAVTTERLFKGKS